MRKPASNRVAALIAAATLAVLAAAAAAPAAAEVGLVDGLWVMKKVDERYEGDDVQEDLLLTLEKTSFKEKNPQVLNVRWLRKDRGRSDALVVHFVAPLYAQGVTLNMEIKPYLDDERFLYLPKANLIRRIHAKDQHTNFMGTDFSYYDLSEREPDEENHKLLRIEALDGALCYVVETTPKESALDGYSKKLFWVDKDRFTKVRIQYFNRAGKLWKQYDPQDWRQLQGIWTPMRLVMVDQLRMHRTTIERTNVRYNQKPDDALFLPQNLAGVRYQGGKFALLPPEQRPKHAPQQPGEGPIEEPRPGER